MDGPTLELSAPSGIFVDTGFINCDNPVVSAHQVSVICTPENRVGLDETAVDDPTTPNIDERATVFPGGVPGLADFNRAVVYPGRRNVEGGGRVSDIQHTDFRIVGGVRGDLSPAWSYDAY